MDLIHGLLSSDVWTALLIVAHTVLGAARATEGLGTIGMPPCIWKTYGRGLKAGVQIASGILHIATAALMVSAH